jgi:hypothetical protein
MSVIRTSEGGVMAEIVGGCLCGAVRYRAEAEPVLIAACHCTACQRNTGAPFSVNLAVPAGSVVVQGDALATYEDRSGASGKVFERSFCGRCGSPILGKGEAYPGLEFLKVGTLDEPSWAAPGAHIWCAEKQPWDVVAAGAQCFEGNPA